MTQYYAEKMDAILNYTKEASYYEILGCDPLSNTDQILKEYKRIAIKYHPDKNPNNPEASVQFQKIQKAKEVLTSVEMRSKYDRWLNSGIAMSFDTWHNMLPNVHNSMHWISKKMGNPSLPPSSASPTPSSFTDKCNHDNDNNNNKGASSTSYNNINKHNSNNNTNIYYHKYYLDKPVDSIKSFWEREIENNEALRRFRNYEI